MEADRIKYRLGAAGLTSLTYIAAILAIVGVESTWMDQRHANHNNPFGLKENDRLIRFDSDDNAISSWEKTFGDLVRGMQDPQQFFNTLQDQGHYDPGNANWVPGMLNTYNSVVNWFLECVNSLKH